MLFNKHALGFLGLNFLLRAHQAFAQEDQAEFETEFRLMILTGDPDNLEIAVTNEDNSESIETHAHHADWAIENNRGTEHGNLLLSWMGFSHASDQDRKVWIYNQGEDRESGKVCTVFLDHDPKVPRLDWYLSWGLDFENTINEFEGPEGLRIQCTGYEPELNS